MKFTPRYEIGFPDATRSLISKEMGEDPAAESYQRLRETTYMDLQVASLGYFLQSSIDSWQQ